MIRTSTLVALLACGLGLARPGAALGDFAVATFDLGTPTVTGTTAQIPVALGFVGEPGDTIEVVQLSVLGSDPLLTAGDTAFGRFTFLLDTTTLPDWEELAPIGTVGFGLYGPHDPIAGPFLVPSASPYLLGTLEIDLSGLPPGLEVFVTLAGGPPGLDTDAGGVVGGMFVPSFAAGDPVAGVAFAEPEGVRFFTRVAEPGGLTLLGLGGLGLVGYARRRARSTGA